MEELIPWMSAGLSTPLQRRAKAWEENLRFADSLSGIYNER